MKLTKNQTKMLKCFPIFVGLAIGIILGIVICNSKGKPISEKFSFANLFSMPANSKAIAALAAALPMPANSKPATALSTALEKPAQSMLMSNVIDPNSSISLANYVNNPAAQIAAQSIRQSASASDIIINGKKGIVVIRDIDAFINAKGSWQDEPGCYSLDAFEEWRNTLKDGNSSSVIGIRLPLGIKAMAFTSSGGWNNICSRGEPVGPILQAGKYHDLSNKNVCGFKFMNDPIMIRSKKGIVSIKDINAIITGKSSWQNEPGCYSLDAFEEWRNTLKDGNSSSVIGIRLPSGIKAMAYTSSGKWDNICSRGEPVGPILESDKYHDLSNKNVCGFKFMKV